MFMLALQPDESAENINKLIPQQVLKEEVLKDMSADNINLKLPLASFVTLNVGFYVDFPGCPI